MKKTTTKGLRATNLTKEAKLVRGLRGERSYREFEGYLNESIPDGMPGTTTFASARNWENGLHPVNGACLMAWIAFYPKDDARHQLAQTVLALRGGSDGRGSAEKHPLPIPNESTMNRRKSDTRTVQAIAA